MDLNKSIYSVFLDRVVNAGVATLQTWNLNNTNKQFLVKSVYFDIQIFDNVTAARLPIDIRTTQLFSLAVGWVVTPKMSKSFENFSTLTNVVNNGGGIVLMKPQHVVLDSWSVYNVVPFTWTYNNTDVLVNYRYQAQIFVEIENLI